MKRQWGLVCLVLGLSLPSAGWANDYWRGWCAGKVAGLHQAERYMQEVRTFILSDERGVPRDAQAQEAFAWLFRVGTFRSFGSHVPGEPYTIDLPEGTQVSCPSGAIQQRPAVVAPKG